jgi:serine phosphatase RsbU (regulator of sigma subunit)
MFRLSDLFQVHQAEEALQAVLACRSGLVVVTGPGEHWPQPGEHLGSPSDHPLSASSQADPADPAIPGLRPPPAEAGFLPSGRNVVFRILAEAALASALEANPNASGVLVSDDSLEEPGKRGAWRRVRPLWVKPGQYAEGLFQAAGRNPDWLLVDRLDESNLLPALEVVRSGKPQQTAEGTQQTPGVRLLSQMDSPFRGRRVLLQMQGMGASPELLSGVAWIVSVLRLPALCPQCRTPYQPTPAQLQRLASLADFPSQAGQPPVPVGGALVYYQKSGCPACNLSGRRGDVAILDVCRVVDGQPEPFLPIEYSLWELVLKGLLALDDLLNFEDDLVSKIYHELRTAQQSSQQSQAALARTRSELQAASRVLNQRNQALFSFQDIGYALIRTDDLPELAGRICRHACLICGTDRAVLYILKPGDQVEIAASLGWQGVSTKTQLDASRVFQTGQGDGPFPYRLLPPGVPLQPAAQGQPAGSSPQAGLSPAEDLRGAAPKVGVQRHYASQREAAEHARKVRQAARVAELNLPAPIQKDSQGGLFVSLVAQGERVGALVIQSMQKKQFTPAETALLQTFANQAALALQRAGLVEDLREKIRQLEAAQVELAEKERMSHEMELARQVQQSVLPQTFPSLPGFAFAARYAAARQVGGDFYDIIELDQGHFGLAIADVSDKGMPAALYMALTRSLLVAQARHELSPARVLRQVNQLLLELSTSDMFVTVFYGVIDVRTRRLSYARAGHDRPILLRQGAGLDLEGQGIALGVMESESMAMQEQQLNLAAGDRLVLFTDGLTDASAPNQEFFGRARLAALLQACASLEAGELCQAVFGALRDFQRSAEQFDDMTMLVIDVL